MASDRIGRDRRDTIHRQIYPTIQYGIFELISGLANVREKSFSILLNK